MKKKSSVKRMVFMLAMLMVLILFAACGAGQQSAEFAIETGGLTQMYERIQSEPLLQKTQLTQYRIAYEQTEDALELVEFSLTFEDKKNDYYAEVDIPAGVCRIGKYEESDPREALPLEFVEPDMQKLEELMEKERLKPELQERLVIIKYDPAHYYEDEYQLEMVYADVAYHPWQIHIEGEGIDPLETETKLFREEEVAKG